MKSTKKSFIMSLLSLVLCFAMLIGTTYAWFTDSVTSGRNKIVAGNLDVELYHSQTGAATTSSAKVDGEENLFKLTENSLWEPGVIVFENFLVKNVGSLDLKYKMTLNVYNCNYNYEGKSLADVLKVAILDTSFTGNRAAAQAEFGEGKTIYTINDFEKESELLPAAENNYAVIIYWEPSENDNEFNLSNGRSSSDGAPLFIEFGINLVATQKDKEVDSFGNDYDANLSLPAIPRFIFTSSTRDVVRDENNLGISWDDGKGNVSTAAAHTNFTLVDTSITETSGKLTRNIETENKDGDIIYDISFTFTATRTTGSGTTSVSSNVVEFNNIITNTLNIGTGLTNVKVTHSHGGEKTPMTELSSATAEGEGYYYDSVTGYLTIKSKTYSDFIVSYVAPVTIQKNFYYDETGKILTGLGDWSTEKKIIIPEGVEEIAAGVFQNNKDIVEVVFPSTVKNISAQAWDAGVFSGCSSLRTIDMSKMTVTSLLCKGNSNNFTFFNANSGTLDVDTIYMPAGITTVNAGTFTGSDVDNIYFAAGITALAENALYETSIKNIYFNTNSLESISFGQNSLCEGCKIHVLEGYTGNSTLQISTCPPGIPAQFARDPITITIVKDYKPAK